MSYLPRLADRELSARLRALGGVVIEGPRACGKTETARQVAASEALLDVDEGARQAAALDPALVLNGPTPRLIDEWQLEPAIWNHVRRAIDDRSAPGQFILTGSAVPPDDATRHTGAGRITRLRMRPMTLFEAGLSVGSISLSALLAGEPARSAASNLSVPDLAEEIARGGWPGFRGLDLGETLLGVRGYMDEICRVDVGRVDGTHRDPERVERLMHSLARNVATYAATTTLARDSGDADEPLDRKTVQGYLGALERLMVVEDQPAWGPHLRSKHIARSASKRHFVDPSLAVAALNASPDALLGDLNLLGFLFESLVVRDLRVYAQLERGRVLQYRDNKGLEIDAIVERPDRRWAAFEIKLGQSQVDEGAANLMKFAERIDTGRCGEPAALAVIAGTGYGYLRKDGVSVIPIGALGP